MERRWGLQPRGCTDRGRREVSGPPRISGSRRRQRCRLGGRSENSRSPPGPRCEPADAVFGWWMPTRRMPSSDGGCQPGGCRLRMVDANPADAVFGWWMPTRRMPSSDGGCQPGGCRLRMVDANPADAVFGRWMPTRRMPSSDGGCQPGGCRLRTVDANWSRGREALIQSRRCRISRCAPKTALRDRFTPVAEREPREGGSFG